MGVVVADSGTRHSVRRQMQFWEPASGPAYQSVKVNERTRTWRRGHVLYPIEVKTLWKRADTVLPSVRGSRHLFYTWNTDS
jgi:hypothetical protein